MAAASVAAYDAGDIRRHEFTRPDKENDRVRHIETLDAQTGPVFLIYRSGAPLNDLLAEAASGTPQAEAELHGVRHSLWVVQQPEQVAAFEAAIGTLDRLYVADGHHRSAAASRVAELPLGPSPREFGASAAATSAGASAAVRVAAAATSAGAPSASAGTPK